jgi:response regulator RpfG family c-di-GMP phosphodiesterase
MRRMRLDASTIGMVVGESVIGQNGRTLIGTGITLDPEVLQRLRDAGVEHIVVQDPAFQDLTFASLVSPKTQQLAADVYSEMRERISQRPMSPVSRVPFNQLARAVIEDAEDIPLDLASYLWPANAARHHEVQALNRASLAVRLGRQRGLGRYIVDIAHAALACDLGMFAVPDVLAVRAPENDEERDLIQGHVQQSLRLLDSSQGWTAVTRTAVAQHHERMDGSGYPQGLKGHQIHPTAALLMICDVYAAMLVPHVDRDERTPEDALAQVMGSAGAELDYEHVAAFHRMVPPFPVGTELELSNGDRAVVLRIPDHIKSRPIVRVFQDCDGNRIEPWMELDLSARMQQATTVVRVIA